MLYFVQVNQEDREGLIKQFFGKKKIQQDADAVDAAGDGLAGDDKHAGG